MQASNECPLENNGAKGSYLLEYVCKFIVQSPKEHVCFYFHKPNIIVLNREQKLIQNFKAKNGIEVIKQNRMFWFFQIIYFESTKANRTLGFLRRTLFSCPQNVKEAAYKCMVR